MKLIDEEETIIVVVGSDERAQLSDRPLGYRLKAEVDRRGDGQAYRRAVVMTDAAYFESGRFEQNPTIAIGGPGVNGLSGRFSNELPTVFNQEDRVFVQADFEGDPKRATLWGVDAAATSSAVDAFILHGLLDDLLKRIWVFKDSGLRS